MYDKACNAGNELRLHRVARRILGRSSSSRCALDAYLADTSNPPLIAYPPIYQALRVYSLSSLVERRVEQLHSLLKRIGRQATYVMPPFACSQLRSQQSVAQYTDDREFKTFCETQWRSTKVADRL